MRDVANCVHNITGRIAIMDKKRKMEMAGRLQLRWQRWEMSNYDYLMQACSQTKLPQHLLGIKHGMCTQHILVCQHCYAHC